MIPVTHRTTRYADRMSTMRQHWIASAAVAIVAGPAAWAQDDSPQYWLDRMAGAVESASYEGTVIRVQDDRVETLKVVRIVHDGVIHEKLVVQEGNGLEIIRKGNEVQCILPDKQSVLVEDWNNQSTLFSSLPSRDIRFGNVYDVSIDREDRVAGRKAVLIAARPHDEYRFGLRVWVDIDTGFPLQSIMIGQDGDPIEQVKFADINLSSDIHASELEPSVSIDDFRWFTQPKRQISHAVASPWTSDELPPGFRVVSAHDETLAGRDANVTHILFSDGLANVSVFIEPIGHKKIAQRSRIGSSNSYSTEVDGHQVTAIGEVPSITVEKIANSMRPN
jgi:sigma-E factor negative regulatory protein RseB